MSLAPVESNESKLLRLASAGSPPAHEWQPAALAVLDLLRQVRERSGWDTCSVCGVWAESRDEEGHGLECCAVLCAGCGQFIEGKFAEDCDTDGDGRPICDQCAIDRDHDNERRRNFRRMGMREVEA